MNRTEYVFTGEIKKQVKSFKAHLQKTGNKEITIRQKTNYAGYFLNWLEIQHLQPGDTRYNDLLDFIAHCTQQGKSKRHVNRIIAAIRDYYEYHRSVQVLNFNVSVNPATGLCLKGTQHKVVSGTIDFKELEDLYQSCKTETLRQKRNKVILGLFIYQAVTTEELQQLEPGHIKLKEGKIRIPGNRKRNSRNLELKPFQILELHEYLNETRPKIINEITKPKPARKPGKIDKTQLENQLFISINGSENIKTSVLHLFRELKKTCPNITNARQIRQSAITYWLKTHNLRQVQYMAGHKYVSSTERYQVNNLESLQSKLEKCHPLSNDM